MPGTRWNEAFEDELSWVDVEALKSAAETGMRFADDPVDSKLMKLSQAALQVLLTCWNRTE